MMKSVLVVDVLSLAVLWSVLQCASGQAFCGVAGTNFAQLGAHPEGPSSRRFYLNVGEPAACTGYISSFTYCYYTPNNPGNKVYLFTFAVYRVNSQTGVYEVNSPVFQVERTDFLGFFFCPVYTLNEPVTVEAGDVLGACVFDPSGRNYKQLDIVGEHSSDLSMLMSTDDGGCDRDPAAVPSTVSSSSLGNVFDRVLHLYANIVPGPLPQTQPPPTTTVATTMETVPVTTAPTTMATTMATTMETVPVTTAPTTMATTMATTMETDPVTTVGDTATTQGITTVSTVVNEQTTNDMMETTTANTPSTNVGSDQTASSNEPVDMLVTTTGNVSVSTPSESIEAEIAQAGGAGAETTAPIVIVVLILVIVAIAVSVVIIVIWTRKQRQTKKSCAIENMMYGITENSGTGYNMSGVYEEIAHSHSQSFDELTQDHTYEFDGATFSGSSKMNECMYAEVGPFDEENARDTNIYSSPLDAPVISYAALLEKNKDEDIYGRENPYQAPATREDEIYFQLKSWGVNIVDVKDIDVVGHLGSGQFGSVEQGQWKRRGTKPVDVAIKSLAKKDSEDKVKFLQEAAIMAQFRHPNVILLHGVVTRGDPMMLVVEFAMKGDLRSFLLSMRPDPGELVPDNTSNMMLYFSQQVALGMQYLSAKGFVHRDLAARNVLVSGDNICKVADFGMSKDLADENYYISQGRDKIPIKWTAPEALHYKKYSTASDVWAYGCLLYEIWSVGYKPFEGVPNVNALRLVDSGNRLSPPPGSPRMIYELMILCWHPKTSLRPAFRDVVLTLVGSEQMVLNIPEEDSSSNPLAGVLGAPLEAGENMYTDLQMRYID